MDRTQRSSPTQLIIKRIVSIKRSLKKGREDPIDLHELGICYYHLANYSQAFHYLELLVKKYSDYLEIGAVRALQALNLIEIGQLKKAEKILQERVQIEQTDIRLLSMLAYVYEKTGRKAEAIQTLRYIFELDSEHLNTLNSLGYLLALDGKQEDNSFTFSCLARAVAANSSHPAYLDSLGVYYVKQGDQARARKALLKALQYAPENAEILEHVRLFLH